jgi:hypothetical protein
MSDQGGADRDEVRVRRAPKYSAFLIVGGGIGAIAAFIATASNRVDPEVGFLQMFLFLGLFGVTLGMLLGGIAALAFDRASARRSTTVTAERSEIVAPVHQPVVEPAMEALPGEAQAAPGEGPRDADRRDDAGGAPREGRPDDDGADGAGAGGPTSRS